MSVDADPTAEQRLPLSRERVLAAAVRIADAEGFEALSMRRLAQELGVQAMSLYNHVANKDAIRDGIVELVMEEIEVPADVADWKAAVRQSAISAHDALLRHRWASDLMMRTATVSPARLEWTEFVLRTLRKAGFSAELTHYAYHALDSHVTGFALWQSSMPFDTRVELEEMAQKFLHEFPVEEYPYFAEHVRWHLEEEPSSHGPTAFEFGLDLILDGLERIRDGS